MTPVAMRVDEKGDRYVSIDGEWHRLESYSFRRDTEPLDWGYKRYYHGPAVCEVTYRDNRTGISLRRDFVCGDRESDMAEISKETWYNVSYKVFYTDWIHKARYKTEAEAKRFVEQEKNAGIIDRYRIVKVVTTTETVTIHEDPEPKPKGWATKEMAELAEKWLGYLTEKDEAVIKAFIEEQKEK